VNLYYLFASRDIPKWNLIQNFSNFILYVILVDFAVPVG